MGWKVTEDQGRAEVAVWRDRDDSGLYKAYLRGRGGRFSLGVMMPEGDRLVIRRTLSVDGLRKAGIWPVQGAEAVMEFSFRTAERLPAGWTRWNGGRSFCDGLVKTALGKSALPWCREEPDGGFTLAFPYSEREPFPMTAIFCFAQVTALGGGRRVLFRFDRAGRPVMHNGEESGKARGVT